MVCNSCRKVFDNINELRFCPYCGAKIEEQIINESPINKEKRFDTLKITTITEEVIKKYNRNNIFQNFKKKIKQKKITILIVTVFLFMVVGVYGYIFIIAKPIDEARIRGDLIGKVIILPKGTNIEIKKDYIKSLSINSRNMDKSKSKEDIKVTVTLNNGTIEVKTLLSLEYINEGKNKWELNEKIGFADDIIVRPAVAMDEKQFWSQLKNLNINIADTSEVLNGEEIKSLVISNKTLDLKNGKEEVLVEVNIDNGLVAEKGKIKCELNFSNEVWSITTIERNSKEDFTLALSPSFSKVKIIEIIKKEGLEETVFHPDLFGGKGFNVNDSFTKKIIISNLKFDSQNDTLNVITKRKNVAGEIKSTLVTGYTFHLSFSNITLLKKSKTTALSVTIDNMSNELIKSSIANVDIEGTKFLFWFTNNHKITIEEAKTFKINEILSKKGFKNVKYVYGNITYMDAKQEKTTPVIALYFLAYNSSRGYTWKINKIIGKDSPNYNKFSKASINQ